MTNRLPTLAPEADFPRREEADEIDRRYREGYADICEIDRQLAEWTAEDVWSEE